MKKLTLAFLLMMTFAASGVCDMNYDLQNPHITYEKTESGMPELIDTLTGNEPEEPTFIMDEVDSDTAQATFPKTFTITVGGDTTLGSTDDLRKRDDCFEKVAEEKGYGWFFSGLESLFTSDDMTLINFEGTLTEETTKK